MLRTLIRLAAVFAAAISIAAGAGITAASASVPQAVHQDHSGIAGYYGNNNGSTRIRDAKATFTVTAEMEQLGTAGGIGVRLCNPNNDFALQDGLFWNGSFFELAYGGVFLTGPSDACVTGGIVGPTEFPGNVNHVNLAIAIGDVITIETYYNPVTHQVTFTATDVTQDATSQAHVTALAQNFREAGVGVLDSNTALLVPPAVNLVVSFTSARFTNYNATSPGKCIIVPGLFDTIGVTALNPAANAVLVPSGVAGCNSFTVSAGIS